MVTRENENVIGIVQIYKVKILINSISRSAIPIALSLSLIGRKDLYTAYCAVKVPWETVSDVIVKFEGLILRKNTDGINAGVDAV